MFDLDGTLIDSREDITTAVNLLRRDYGLAPLSMDTVAGYVGDGIRALVERALQGHPADLEAARRAGVRSVWLSYGIGEVAGERPNLRFESFRGMVDHFAG
ncbi:MAG: HAD hydrolase-like protein [Kiritimatiellae bacterium]|nr:HAD hydrolase-like protein [Kiritimatiellia bacterium]